MLTNPCAHYSSVAITYAYLRAPGTVEKARMATLVETGLAQGQQDRSPTRR